MSRFFFSGSQVAKLDEKGRFVLPQEMRYGLVEEGKCLFSIGLSLGGCLAIYRRSEMEKIVEVFQKHQHVAKLQKFFTLFFSTLYQTECDKVGRIMLPQTLRNLASIQKEIVVAGVLDKIELWAKEKYDTQMEGFFQGEGAFLDMAAEAFSLLQKGEGAKESVESMLHPLLTDR